MLDVGETDGICDGARVGRRLILGIWLGFVVILGESDGIDIKDGISLGTVVGSENTV
jgi:hypothetical protein